MSVGLQLVLTAVGIGLGVKGQSDQRKATRRTEAQQRQRANLEAARRRREQLRQAQIARANAAASGVQTGSLFSSGVAGGQASATSTSRSNIQGINQGQEIGANIAAAQGDVAQAQALGSLGGSLVQNAGTISRIGQFATGGGFNTSFS